MKAVIFVGMLALTTGVSFGQDFDPFAEPSASPLSPDPNNPDRDKPKMVRVQLEFVEVAHADCTELMTGKRDAADATALRVKLAEMVDQDRAEVVETMMVVGRSGKKATSESVQEFILPVAYEPPRLPTPGRTRLPPEDIVRIRLRIPLTPTAFETRNLGSTFEAAPKLRGDGRTIDLSLAPEMVLPAGYAVHQEFTAIGGHQHQARMPIFVTERVNTAVTCRDGQYVLVTVLTPSDEAGEIDPSRKMFVLVKCDVLVVK